MCVCVWVCFPNKKSRDVSFVRDAMSPLSLCLPHPSPVPSPPVPLSLPVPPLIRFPILHSCHGQTPELIITGWCTRRTRGGGGGRGNKATGNKRVCVCVFPPPLSFSPPLLPPPTSIIQKKSLLIFFLSTVCFAGFCVFFSPPRLDGAEEKRGGGKGDLGGPLSDPSLLLSPPPSPFFSIHSKALLTHTLLCTTTLLRTCGNRYFPPITNESRRGLRRRERGERKRVAVKKK